jgi:hypothetical protein
VIVHIAAGSIAVATGYTAPRGMKRALVAAPLAPADRRTIRKGGLSGRSRTVLHLWRMCFAFFFAAGSFSWGSKGRCRCACRRVVRLCAGLAPLALMVFWLNRVRVRFAKRRFERGRFTL